MARYMLLWEVDTSRTPEDPKTKKAQYLGFHDVVAKQLKEGLIKEWGLFVGEVCGYTIFEGSAVEVHTLIARWIPFTKFKVRELMTFDESLRSAKSLPE
jgi:hypothetical protein